MSHKKNIERFHVDDLLTRITKLGYSMPISIADSERPDFILTYADGQIGLETTRSVYQEYVRAGKLQDQKFPQEFIVITNLKDGQSRRSNDDIVSDMFDFEGPWNNCENHIRDWRDKVAASLKSKREKLNGSGFQILPRNWLLIYDDPPLGNDVFTYERACRHLLWVFHQASGVAKEYDAVFVLSHRYLFRWDKDKLSIHYQK